MEDEATQTADGVIGQLWNTLIENYGAAAPFYVLGAIGLIMMIIAVPILLRKRKDPLERFSFSDERLRSDLVRLRDDTDDGSLKGLADYLEPKDQEEMSETRSMLRSAGYRGGAAVRQFYFARAGLAVLLLAIGMVATFLIPAEPDLMFSAIITGLMALAGYFLPSYWVRRKIATRKEEITNAFPDAMDMMLVCVEGGQSLDQAMARVGEEMETSSGPLAEEFALVSHEFRAGKDRISVLRDFASRCAVSDISSFVTVLIQSSTFGTSIAQALRVYAAEMRDKRLMRAEEKANMLPTKLTLGTMMFTVPPLILILVGPSFIMILRSLGGLAGGGGGPAVNPILQP
ncbi:MAG: type II secretion system F family protein [Proteobacteria bacterium]|nr:type II secretion system F family protein [Pseudomonadota bacterium]